jgi:hypothetical protein
LGPDCIDHRGLLTDEQMARAVQHQTALLLGLLVGTNRMLALVTASQMASASVASFFWRAFAVLMLMTNSNLVGCCTGISAGFSPFSMRPTYIPVRRFASCRSRSSSSHRPPGTHATGLSSGWHTGRPELRFDGFDRDSTDRLQSKLPGHLGRSGPEIEHQFHLDVPPKLQDLRIQYHPDLAYRQGARAS